MEASESSGAPVPPWATAEPKQPEPDPVPETGGGQDDDAFAERPEVYVGAAFAGGLTLALALRWLGSR